MIPPLCISLPPFLLPPSLPSALPPSAHSFILSFSFSATAKKSQKQISTEEAFTFARDHGFVKCFETSVKDGTNINEALE